MNRWIFTSGLAGALALPLLLVPAGASASCSDRQVTGTVVGGVGGALIGNSIARGGGGAVLGGLGGAVLGHEVARHSCGRERYRYRHAQYRGAYRSYDRRYPAPVSDSYAGAGQYPAEPSQHAVYYDHRGGLIDQTPTAYAAANAPNQDPSSGYAGPGQACRPETRSYYNDRGELAQQVQTCAR